MRNFILVESVREIAFNNKELFIVTYDIANNNFDKEEVVKILPTLWELLLENIVEFNWIEASGSVEKLLKQHNAFMLPNKYVTQVLNKKCTLCKDGFHYQRLLGDEVVEKMIFGINSEDLLNTISNEVFGKLLGNIKTTYEKLRASQNLNELKKKLCQ